MTDQTTKILLALIALGLWANLAIPLLRPIVAAANKADELVDIANELSAISHSTCTNSKIC